MQRIYVNIDDVRTTNGKLTRNVHEIGDTADGVLRVKSGIDSRILARRSIGARLSRASSNMQNVEDKFHELNSFIFRSAESYWDTERRLKKEAVMANKIKSGSNDSFLDYFIANAWETTKSSMGGYAMFAAAKDLLKLADGVNFKLYKENGRVFIKLVGEAMTRPADYLRYRNLLIEKLGGESADWKKGYVKRMMNKGIALYDGINEHLNNNAAFRLAKSKYSNTALAPLNQYVRNIGEPWYKVAGNTFKSSFIENAKAVFYDDWRGFKGAAANIKISKGLGIVGTGIMVYENAKSAHEAGSLKKFVVDTSVDLTTGIGSMAAGAAVGSWFLPPVGTVVGAATGVLINLAINWKIPPEKKSAVDYTKDFVSNPVESIEGIGKKLDEIFW